MNYAKALPRDRGGETMQNHPAPFASLARYGAENSSASSVITVTDNTTVIEIEAQGNAAVMRWVAASDTQASVISAAATANFDHVIPSGMYRRFVIPQELAMPQTSIVGANVQNGLYKRFAIKSIGVASVLSSEF